MMPLPKIDWTRYPIFDIHSHLIPELDDGAKSLDEAIELLRLEKENGVGAVIATPHFYGDVFSYEEYSAKADAGFQMLKEVSDDNLPQLLKGYEVRYFHNISQTSDLPLLTLNGSKYLLLEIRYNSEITDRVTDEIAEICYSWRITPILAHIERFCEYRGYKRLLSLIEDGIALAQIDSDSFGDRKFRKEALRLIKKEQASFIASDCHSIDARPPMIQNALTVVEKELGKNCLDILINNGQELYKKIINKNTIETV